MTDYSWIGDDVGEWDGEEPTGPTHAEGPVDNDDVVVLYDAKQRPIRWRSKRIGYVR